MAGPVRMEVIVASQTCHLVAVARWSLGLGRAHTLVDGLLHRQWVTSFPRSPPSPGQSCSNGLFLLPLLFLGAREEDQAQGTRSG